MKISICINVFLLINLDLLVEFECFDNAWWCQVVLEISNYLGYHSGSTLFFRWRSIFAWPVKADRDRDEERLSSETENDCGGCRLAVRFTMYGGELSWTCMSVNTKAIMQF